MRSTGSFPVKIQIAVLVTAAMVASGCGGNANVKNPPASPKAQQAAPVKKAAPPAVKTQDAATVSVVRPSQKNPAAADFTLQDLNQDLVSLSDYRGKNPVLLFFWTTWCPFCQRELQVLNTSYPQLVQAGVEVLAVNIGETADRVRSTVDSYRLAYRVLLDKDESVSGQYEVIGVPTYVLINTNGEVVFQDNYFPGAYNDLLSSH